MNGAHISDALPEEIKQKTKSGSGANIMPTGTEKSTSDQQQRMNISTLSPSDSSFSSLTSSQEDAEAVCGLISGTIENKRVLVKLILSCIVFVLQSGSRVNGRNAVLGKFMESQILEANVGVPPHN